MRTSFNYNFFNLSTFKRSYSVKMYPIFDGSDLRCPKRYQITTKLTGGLLGYKNLSNWTLLTLKFHNSHHTNPGNDRNGDIVSCKTCMPYQESKQISPNKYVYNQSIYC